MLAVTFAGKLRTVPTPQLFVGVVCAAQVAVFAYLQFGYHVESLEMYFFSSTLWGVICLALAVALAEACRPLSARRLARWLPAVAVLAVPLAYEACPHVPAFEWVPTGVLVAIVPVVATTALRIGGRVVQSAPCGEWAGALRWWRPSSPWRGPYWCHRRADPFAHAPCRSGARGRPAGPVRDGPRWQRGAS